MVEFVDATSLAEIIAKHRDLTPYLCNSNNSISIDTMNAFVKSCGEF